MFHRYAAASNMANYNAQVRNMSDHDVYGPDMTRPSSHADASPSIPRPTTPASSIPSVATAGVATPMSCDDSESNASMQNMPGSPYQPQAPVAPMSPTMVDNKGREQKCEQTTLHLPLLSFR